MLKLFIYSFNRTMYNVGCEETECQRIKQICFLRIVTHDRVTLDE